MTSIAKPMSFEQYKKNAPKQGGYQGNYERTGNMEQDYQNYTNQSGFDLYKGRQGDQAALDRYDKRNPGMRESMDNFFRQSMPPGSQGATAGGQSPNMSAYRQTNQPSQNQGSGNAQYSAYAPKTSQNAGSTAISPGIRAMPGSQTSYSPFVPRTGGSDEDYGITTPRYTRQDNSGKNIKVQDSGWQDWLAEQNRVKRNAELFSDPKNYEGMTVGDMERLGLLGANEKVSTGPRQGYGDMPVYNSTASGGGGPQNAPSGIVSKSGGMLPSSRRQSQSQFLEGYSDVDWTGRNDERVAFLKNYEKERLAGGGGQGGNDVAPTLPIYNSQALPESRFQPPSSTPPAGGNTGPTRQGGTQSQFSPEVEQMMRNPDYNNLSQWHKDLTTMMGSRPDSNTPTGTKIYTEPRANRTDAMEAQGLLSARNKFPGGYGDMIFQLAEGINPERQLIPPTALEKKYLDKVLAGDYREFPKDAETLLKNYARRNNEAYMDEVMKKNNVQNPNRPQTDVNQVPPQGGTPYGEGSKKNPYGFTPPAQGESVTQAMVPYHNPTTGETWTAPSGGYKAPKGWEKGNPPSNQAGTPQEQIDEADGSFNRGGYFPDGSPKSDVMVEDPVTGNIVPENYDRNNPGHQPGYQRPSDTGPLFDTPSPELSAGGQNIGGYFPDGSPASDAMRFDEETGMWYPENYDPNNPGHQPGYQPPSDSGAGGGNTTIMSDRALDTMQSTMDNMGDMFGNLDSAPGGNELPDLDEVRAQYAPVMSQTSGVSLPTQTTTTSTGSGSQNSYAQYTPGPQQDVQYTPSVQSFSQSRSSQNVSPVPLPVPQAQQDDSSFYGYAANMADAAPRQQSPQQEQPAQSAAAQQQPTQQAYVSQQSAPQQVQQQSQQQSQQPTQDFKPVSVGEQGMQSQAAMPGQMPMQPQYAQDQTLNMSPGSVDINAIAQAYGPGTTYGETTGLEQAQQKQDQFNQMVNDYQGPTMNFGTIDGGMTDFGSAMAQRDAFIERINAARRPAFANPGSGAGRNLDFRSLLEQAGEDVQGGFRNPFGYQNQGLSGGPGYRYG